MVAGRAGLTGSSDFAAARYDPDGTLDASFGTGGRVVVDVGGGTFVEGARAVVIEADGGIVLGGATDAQSGGGFVLLGLRSDGSVDTSFGTAGKFQLALGKWAECSDVVLQRDGKIRRRRNGRRLLRARCSCFVSSETAPRTRRSERAESPGSARPAVWEGLRSTSRAVCCWPDPRASSWPA